MCYTYHVQNLCVDGAGTGRLIRIDDTSSNFKILYIFGIKKLWLYGDVLESSCSELRTRW